MTKPYMKPLALAVSACLALSACSQSDSNDHQAPVASGTVAGSQSAASPATTSSAAPAAAGTSASVFNIGDLDSSANACSNFDTFVNAKWVAANPIPADRSRWGAFDQLAENALNTQHDILEDASKNVAQAKAGSIEQKLGWLYQAGMDEAAIDKAGFDPIKPQLGKIAALKDSAQLVDWLDESYANGDGYVFSFGSGTDFKDATKTIAYTGQDGLGLPTKDYYTDPKHAEERKAYQAYIAKTLELTGVPAAEAAKQAEQVLALETALAKDSLAPVDMRDLDNEYKFISFKQADAITPHFNWEKFFKAQGLTPGDGFSMAQPKFFSAFDHLLTTTPIDAWKAYLSFHTIDSASPYLAKAFQDNRFDFYGKTLSGQPQQQDRWKRVIHSVNGAMGEALGQLFVARTFTPEAKQRAEDLVNNVRDALKSRIENLDWMTPETKAKAIDKWNKFLPKIGYPDHWRDWAGLDIKQGDFYGDVEAASKFNYHYDLAKIGKPTDRSEWMMTPQTVNAYYDPSTNTINFPAAILQPPFFYAKGDDAINYGGIGAVIGHESSHGFDDQGSQFDGDGNRANWWGPTDATQFKARTAKLVQQFNDYTPIKARPDLHVNGSLTLGENIADLGGLNVAYDALQTALKKNPQEASEKIDGYTEDQRFFLNWARVWRGNVREKQAVLYLNVDPHAPASLRAIAAPSNMPAFAQAFQCKAGDPMVRGEDKQVKIW